MKFGLKDQWSFWFSVLFCWYRDWMGSWRKDYTFHIWWISSDWWQYGSSPHQII